MSSRSSTSSTPRTRRSRRYAATLGTVIAASLLWALSPSAALAVSDPSGTASTTAPPPPSNSRVGNAYDPTGYWTLERMAKATPVKAPTTSSSTAQQRVGDGSSGVTPPAAPTVSSTARAVPVPTTVGKVFFVSSADGKDHVCTAATINTAKKNLVETAAHCVYTQGSGWHSKILFSPAYFNGPSSYGTYSWSTARTFTTWMNTSNTNYDQAFVAFYPRNGVQLVNAVGGNGFMYGVSTVQSGVRIWGYPVEGKYAGYKTPLYCDGTTRTGSNPKDAMMTCDMTGGASGGPWLKNRINANLGYVMAATSRRTLTGTPSLLAIPNNSSTKAMLDQMG